MSRVSVPAFATPEGARWSFDAGDHVAGVAWLPDGQRLAVAPSEGELAVLDRATGARRLTFPAHVDGNAAISASSREPWLATAGHDGKVRVWNCDSGALVRELEAGHPWVEQVAFSPDGTLLAATAGRILRVWDAAGELQIECADHDSTIAALAWRPDSRGIGTGCYNGAQLFRQQDGAWESAPYEELRWRGSIISLAWSPNGRYVGGGSQEATIQFWKLPYRVGEELFMSGYQTKVKELAWDKESRFLASGGGEIITVWDVSGKGPRGRTPLQLEGHAGRVTALAFQGRGPLLASGGADGSAFVWDLQAGTRHRRQLAPAAPISALTWSGDGSALALGAADGTVCVWECRPGA